jgi:hypothetical protein
MHARLLAFSTMIWIAASCAGGGGDSHGGGGVFGSPPGPSSMGTQGGGNGGITPGTLTAGAWDDNANFDFYRSYLAEVEANPADVAGGLPSVPRADRMTITVLDGNGLTFGGATVTIAAAGAPVFTTTSGADGRVLFFPAWAGVTGELTITATGQGMTGTATAQTGDATASVMLPAVSHLPPNAVDVALVVDTTGSMGDELEYLKVELEAITGAVQTTFPGISQRWALVVYRDENMGDAYDVRTTPFTDDIGAFQKVLAQQSAGGGGDFPEIPDRGLEGAAQLAWRPGNVARLVFLVGDAPTHADRAPRFANAVASLRTSGVRIYPVGASGIDEVAEYEFRTAAELSGGRYLFLTDDSGVGDPHKEPTLPCYLVTKLNQAMVRMIAIELSGAPIAPDPSEIIRTGGDPTDGRCTLASGQIVSAL